MPTLVTIPNIGEVEFPDGMSDDDIAAAAHKLSNPEPWYSGPKAFKDAYMRQMEIAKADPNSVFGQEMRRNEEMDNPMISLPRAPQAESTLGQVASGIYNGAIAPAIETMTSPNAVMTAPVAAAGRLASAALAPVMGVGAVQQGAQAIQQAGNPDATLQQIVEPAAGAVASAVMAAGAGRHALSQPKTPTPNVSGGKTTAPTSKMVESNQETPSRIQGSVPSIQGVSRVPNVQGESAGGAGLPPHQPERKGNELVSAMQDGEGTLPGGTQEMRDPVRELPSETPRGEAAAPAQPAPRTIETVGEGQLFRNDEIPFNLAGEVDASAAEAPAAAEVKSQADAKAAQEAAQVKMFEEPAAVVDNPEATKPVVDNKTPKTNDKPADPLMDALDADLQTARSAGDKAKVSTLAALKVNYLLGKAPAVRKVEKAYGEQAAQPALPERQRARLAKKEFQTAKDVFMEDPVIKTIVDNGGIISKSRMKQKGGEDWERSKSFYDALETMQVQKEHYHLIYPNTKKTGVMPLSPDKMAAILWDSGLLKKGHPDELVEYIAEASTKMSKGAFKSHDEHMSEQAEIHEQQAATKGLHLSVDDMAPGDTLRLPTESGGGTARVMDVDADGNVTIEMPKGITITIPAGNSLKVADHIRGEERTAGADEPF